MPRQREMRLVNAQTGESICRFCGSRHFVFTNPQTGKVFRNLWRCKNPDCLPKRLREAKAKIEFKTAVGAKPEEKHNEYRTRKQDQST